MCVCMPRVYRCLGRPEEGSGFPETVVIGCYELADISSGNQTQVLEK